MTSYSLRTVFTLVALALSLGLVGCVPATPPEATRTPPVSPPAPTALPSITSPSPATAVPSPTAGRTTTVADRRMDALVQFVLRLTIKEMGRDSYISQVGIGSREPNDPLVQNEETLRQCWAWEAEQTRSMDCKAMMETSKQEQQTARWKHGIAVFAVVSVDRDYSQAVIRLDQVVRPMMGGGYLITLANSDGQWREVSRMGVWIS